MTTLDLVATIDATWFGAGLSERSRERLAALSNEREVPGGTCLLAEGSETRELGVVLSGRVALQADVHGQGVVTLMTVEAGDIYGWSAILPPFVATSTVVAVDRARVLTFDGAPLRAALRSDHELAANLYQQVLEAVARRLVATRHQLLDLLPPSSG
jgi:CRP-like cAMP-binding protein